MTESRTSAPPSIVLALSPYRHRRAHSLIGRYGLLNVPLREGGGERCAVSIDAWVVGVWFTKFAEISNYTGARNKSRVAHIPHLCLDSPSVHMHDASPTSLLASPSACGAVSLGSRKAPIMSLGEERERHCSREAGMGHGEIPLTIMHTRR